MIDQEELQQHLSCRRAQRVLQSYLDGILDEAGARYVTRHLATCRRCSREAESYREIKRSLVRLHRSRQAVQRLRRFGEALHDELDH